MRLYAALLLAAAAAIGCGSKEAPAITVDVPARPPASASAAAPRGDRVAECKAFIEALNAGIEQLQQASRLPPNSEAEQELVSMADALDATRVSLEAVTLTDPELVTLRGQYRRMSSDVARSARELAAAADANDVPRLQIAKEALEKAVKQEDPIVERVNALCSPP